MIGLCFLSITCYRYRESAIGSYSRHSQPLGFDIGHFAPQLDGALYGVRHQHLERCENAAVESCDLPSSRLSYSLSNQCHFLFNVLVLLSSCLSLLPTLISGQSQTKHVLQTTAQLNSRTSFAAESTATASGSRGATGCIPLHRYLQVRCCACQRRISSRRIDCRDTQRPKPRRHVELRAASRSWLCAHRMERDRVRVYERHVVELGFNSSSTDTQSRILPHKRSDRERSRRWLTCAAYDRVYIFRKSKKCSQLRCGAWRC